MKQFVSIKDIQGLVMETGRIGKQMENFISKEELNSVIRSELNSSDNSETRRTDRQTMSSDSLEIPLHIGTGIDEEELDRKIREEIAQIWPVIDDLIVNAALETKGTLIYKQF